MPLVTAGSSYSFAAARADRIFWGRLVENAVGAHLVQTLAGQGRLEPSKNQVQPVHSIATSMRPSAPGLLRLPE